MAGVGSPVRSWYRRYGRIIGALVSLASLAFFFYSFAGAGWGQAKTVFLGAPGRLVLWAGVYTCGLIIIAWMWPLIIALVTDRPVQALASHRSHAVTQIGKYLPGNVGHFIGRHALMNKLGFAHDKLALAAVLEIILFASTVAVVGLVSGGRALFEQGFSIPAWYFLLAGGLAAVLVFSVLRQNGPGLRLRNVARPLFRLASLPRVLSICLGYAVFIVLSAWIVDQALGAASPGVSPLLLGSVSIAWLAGYVTPGSAGGLGVREVVLIALLAPTTGISEATAAAFLYRFTTITGDGLIFIYGLTLGWLGAGRGHEAAK